MKKIPVLLLALVAVLLLLTSCKSEEAKAVDSAIAALGEVTLESEKDISTIENMVESLEEADAKQLDNLDDLKKARETYENLVKEHAIEQIEDAINAIGTVTLDSKSAIETARSLFNSNEKEIQECVQNIDLLEQAERKFQELRAGKVKEMISQIGDVTIEKREQIQNAKNEFDALTAKEKNLVSNKDILTSSLQQVEKLVEEKKAKELDAALSKIAIDRDEFNETVRYRPTSYPYYVNKRTFMLPCIYEDKSGERDLRLTFNYYGSNWIFFEKALIVVDGENYEKNLNFIFPSVKRDILPYGYVVEAIDILVDENDIDMLKKIAASNSTKVRLTGEYSYEWTVSAADKQGITDLLNVYEIMMQK